MIGDDYDTNILIHIRNAIVTDTNLQNACTIWKFGIFNNGVMPKVNTTHCLFEEKDILSRFQMEAEDSIVMLNKLALELTIQIEQLSICNPDMLQKFQSLLSVPSNRLKFNFTVWHIQNKQFSNIQNKHVCLIRNILN